MRVKREAKDLPDGAVGRDPNPLGTEMSKAECPPQPLSGVAEGGLAEFCYNSDNAAGRYGLILAHNKTSPSSGDSNIEP